MPLVAIAVYALALRVGDYGWTTDRLIAAAGLLIASFYAVGYASGAIRAGWLATIPKVNIATSFVILGVLLVMFSPAGDPARLSVNSQLARLASGEVPADKFDFAYLRFEGARYGRDALARLDAGASGSDAAVIRERIATVRKMSGPWDREAKGNLTPQAAVANITLWPAGARLAESFVRTDWARHPRIADLPDCLSRKTFKCDARLSDLNGDGKPELILIGTTEGVGAAVLGEDSQGNWHFIARLPYYLAGCKPLRKHFTSGTLRPLAPVLQDLEIGGIRVEVNALGDEVHCADAPSAAKP